MKRKFTKYPSNYINATTIPDTSLEYSQCLFRENHWCNYPVTTIYEVDKSTYELVVTVDHSGDYYKLNIGISADELLNAYNNFYNFVPINPLYVNVVGASSISNLSYDELNLMNSYDSSQYDYEISFR